jgi:flap endonuclease-1
MGLDLKPLLTPRPIQIAELSGKVVAVDAFNTIYQFLATIRGPDGSPLTNGRGEVTSHLTGLFYRNVNLLMEGVKPVYVFDGKMHALKAQEVERRSQVKQEAMAQYNHALEEGRMEDAVKYGKRTSILTGPMVDECKRLLSLLGIPSVQAPADGEAAAAYLTKAGLAYASASQDYDSILFGAKRLVRNLAISGKRKVPNRNAYVDVEPELYEHDAVLKELGLTHEQLVDVGILIGTDFNPGGFAGIGPKTALKLVKEHGRLEEIAKIKDALSEVPYQEIRDIFLKPGTPALENGLQFGDVDREKVLDFLCVDKSFSTDRVAGTLDRLQKAKENRTQSLEKWFG